MTNEINKCDDIIDVRDVIARVEELEELLGEENAVSDIEEATTDGGTDLSEEAEELNTLTELLSDLSGNGGDEQWRGDWYPVTLIRDSYFEDYAQELFEDIGDMPKGVPSYIVVDWEATARNIQMDYSSVEFQGVTFWYR